MIRRRGQGPEEEESSSDEEDAFSALSEKVKKEEAKIGSSNTAITNITNSKDKNVNSESSLPKETAGGSCKTPSSISQSSRLPMAKTSSMKRHHKPSEARKANMDALIQELEAEKNLTPSKLDRFVPEKKGSFVEAGEEYLTTNLFVGNLAPSITEEDLSNLFSQFGELYSVKIMWPRTVEERNRRRNTGFVCFMNRDDAEEAIAACDDIDFFNNGRLLMLRWGKNVIKERREIDEPNKGLVEKLNEVPTKYSSSSALPDVDAMNTFDKQDQDFLDRAFQTNLCEAKMHASRSIHVEIPTDQSRFHFMSITAQYVAKDPELEQRIKEEEKGNPRFSFLTLDCVDENDLKEMTFYRWRVYSFCQGDTYSIWRTEPFIMLSQESALYWIPPPLDMKAVDLEKANAKEKENRLRQQKVDRSNRELMTGRQFEREIRRKRRGEFGSNDTSKLNPDELSQFDQLVRKELSISRERICRAMAFCFDHCAAAQDISGLIKQALLDESDSVTNDMRIARLYLLSDVLFNSQQPGVRNAFMYRSSIESSAPEIFRKLGFVIKSEERRSGRITVNKLRKVISAILAAWTEWGVFDAAFMDELEAHLEGREVKNDFNKDENKLNVNAKDCEDVEEEEEEVVIHEARGDWKEVSNEVDERRDDIREKMTVVANLTTNNLPVTTVEKSDDSETNSKRRKKNSTVENKPAKFPNSNSEKIDEKEASNGTDGEELDGEALDGEAFDDLDGEPMGSDTFNSDEIL